MDKFVIEKLNRLIRETANYFASLSHSVAPRLYCWIKLRDSA
jgi:hypothetical protein